MDHSIPLITTLAAGFGLALVFGFIAEKLKFSALVGYLFAGIVMGPYTPGFVGDVKLAGELSEIGVMLLMFGVGLHFSLGDLMAVKKVVVPGALLQMLIASILGCGVSYLWGWNFGAAVVFGLSLSCASTVVVIKSLEARGLLSTMNGRIAMGWLVVQDLVTVLLLVLLPPLSGVLGGEAGDAAQEHSLWLSIILTLAQVAAFIVLMLVVGRRLLPWLLLHVARVGTRELFTLSVVAIAIGIAYGAAAVFHVSFALGAFFAGMVMRESEFSHRAAQESLPLRDAFAVLFFVSVGMLFEPAILVQHPFQVLAVVAIVLLANPIVIGTLVVVCRYRLDSAMTIAASLAQIGEFSFILVGLGVSLKLLPETGQSLILAGALISIALNPLALALVKPLKAIVLQRSSLARRLENREDPLAALPMATEETYLSGQVVLVGYGRVGRRIGEALEERGIPFVVVEQNRERVEQIRNRGMAAVSGDSADPETLIQAHIVRAAMLVIATPGPLNVQRMTETAKTLNPNIEVVIRTESAEAAEIFRRDGLGRVFFDEEELARGMRRYVLSKFVPLQEATGS